MTTDESHRTPVDLLDTDGRFVTSASCAVRRDPAGGGWRGMLDGVEPNKRLISGRYRLRTRGGREAWIVIQARQRIGEIERYPFVGEGSPPPME